MKLKIIRVTGGIFIATDGIKNYSIISPGKIKKQYTLLVGDEVSVYKSEDQYIIEEVFPRKNELYRPKCANIDYFILIQSILEPYFDRILVDKLLVYSFINNIIPIIVLTKSDLNSDMADKIKYEYTNYGYNVFKSEIDNLYESDKFLEMIHNKTVVLAGNSGVGKSTLLNNLSGDVNQKTNSISDKLGRGKHTTRHCEAFTINKTLIIDTPGFSSFSLNELPEGKYLSEYFLEMDKYSNKCKFKPCSHIHEPECYIKKMVENGEITQERYLSYKKILDELEKRRMS